MAKMIKCPTCGTQIEVPANPTGQIVKCPGCGKGLKLVAKKPAGAPSAAQGSPGGSVAGGSLSGATVSAMTYHGESPASSPADDMPNLDSVCAVCGRATEPEDLVEDNGKLVCRDCIKGARSRIDRPTGGAEEFQFKGPASAPVKRSPIINPTISLVIFVIAAIVLIICQVYLTLKPKPEGTLTASTLTPGAVHRDADTTPVAPAPPPGPILDTASATSQPASPGGNPATTSPAATPPGNTQVAIDTNPQQPPPTVEHTPAPTNPENVANPTATPPANPTTQSIFTLPDETQPQIPPTQQPNPPAAVPGPGNPAGHGPVAPAAIVSSSNDPLVKGMELLQSSDYVKAQTQFDLARSKYRPRAGQKLTPEQQMTLVGLAASCLGQHATRPSLEKLETAKAAIDLVMADGQKSRSAVLDYAICVAYGARPKPGNNKAQELGMAIETMHDYLGTQRDDEYAANVYGTLLDKASTMPGVAKEKLAAQWETFDRYIDQLATTVHPDQLKWGIDWMPKELVQRYRESRDHTAGAAPAAPQEKLQQELDQAKAAVIRMQKAYEQAKNSGGDVIGAKNQLEAAQANAFRIQMQMDQAGAPAPKPKWLDKFQPVLPEGTVTTQ